MREQKYLHMSYNPSENSIIHLWEIVSAKGKQQLSIGKKSNYDIMDPLSGPQGLPGDLRPHFENCWIKLLSTDLKIICCCNLNDTAVFSKKGLPTKGLLLQYT